MDTMIPRPQMGGQSPETRPAPFFLQCLGTPCFCVFKFSLPPKTNTPSTGWLISLNLGHHIESCSRSISTWMNLNKVHSFCSLVFPLVREGQLNDRIWVSSSTISLGCFHILVGWFGIVEWHDRHSYSLPLPHSKRA